MAGEVLNTNIDLTSLANGEDTKTNSSNGSEITSTEMSMEYEEIPAFEEIRTKLFPLVKTDVWLKQTKERLYGTSQSVFYKPLNNVSRIDCGFTVAIMSDEFHYVLNSYLVEWHISAMTLVQISQANLRKLFIQEGKMWQTSQTGIRFMEGVGTKKQAKELLPNCEN